ncbi:hypothetical protein [Streptomyces roseoviridis]|uniref:SMP-30/gluconolactonase/LRE family protein n=1 Tax=Streptomyces roseoviridis TaxID=67361 RepID=A0ABV5QGU9_9ACTN
MTTAPTATGPMSTRPRATGPVPRRPRPARLATAVAAATALALLAAGPASAGDPTVTDPRIVAHFDLAQGQTPENIALEPDGSANLTWAFARQVVRVDKHGEVTLLAELPDVADPQTPGIGAAVVLGIARALDGTLYVTYATGREETGIWRIGPGGGAPEQIGFFPAGAMPNGLAFDEECGTLYTADSALGRVWSLPVTGGTPTVWAAGPALEATPALPFGANGLKVHDGAVWVSNTARGTLLRIPVKPDESAGPVEIRATGLDFIDDFDFTGHGDTVLAALIESNRVELVRPDGTHRTVLTAADGLDNPTSVAVGGKTVHVTSGAFLDPANPTPDPNLLVAKLKRK